jgi:two-component system sensor histidine kinase KdpD
MTDARPDPDALLARLDAEAARVRRGALKIFFGASAGVGKTYAMLSAAREAQAAGVDVVVGLVETHGRGDTAALLDGLERLPVRPLVHRERTLAEFDLDAALARRPQLLLVDELAHSNAPGSRHAKRWQDVEDLVAAGIDVWTTVNVQHLDRLNDVVGGVTGIRVRETVPDHVFDGADEVVLVDLPPDELLDRLARGKIYVPDQAERAARGFFLKGTLLALRELALRRTADRVDGDMQHWRRDQDVARVWRVRDSLLVAVGAHPDEGSTVRSAARLAAQLDVPWHAVLIETPALQRLPAERRARMLDTLRLAESLGARTATLPGDDPAAALVQYARSLNLAKLVLGRGTRRGWRGWRPSLALRIQRLGDDLDVIEIARTATDARGTPGGPSQASAPQPVASGRGAAPWAWTIAACVAVALVATALLPVLALVNIVMLFLLTVLGVAWTFGRGPAALAAVLAVLLFDFGFVPPRFTFAVEDVEYVVTFAVMLATGLLVGQLAADLRFQARAAAERELRARRLFELSRDLSGAIVAEQIVDIAQAAVRTAFDARTVLLLPDAEDRLVVPPTDGVDDTVAHWVHAHAEPAGLGTATLATAALRYVPLVGPMRVRGVLALDPARPALLANPEAARELEVFAALIGIALERVHYIAVAQDALVNVASERLRSTLLQALSHDVRTPLTVLRGLAEQLALTPPTLSPAHAALVDAMRDEAARMAQLIDDLLEMARLRSGPVVLDRQWQSIEELVGGAIRARAAMLADHPLAIALPADLPLVECDALLIERVLCNLLENAARHTPPGTAITVGAAVDGPWIVVDVADDGPGLPPGDPARLFETFARGTRESTMPGTGLGLAIARAAVEAHGGRIEASNRVPRGARFAFRLPAGTPPAVDAHDVDDAAASAVAGAASFATSARPSQRSEHVDRGDAPPAAADVADAPTAGRLA